MYLHANRMAAGNNANGFAVRHIYSFYRKKTERVNFYPRLRFTLTDYILKALVGNCACLFPVPAAVRWQMRICEKQTPSSEHSIQ